MSEFDAFDEPGEPSGRGMRALVADLGLTGRDVSEWTRLVPTPMDVGIPALAARLDHADLEVRRMVSHVLEWFWADADEALRVIETRLEAEDDAPARFGLV